MAIKKFPILLLQLLLIVGLCLITQACGNANSSTSVFNLVEKDGIKYFPACLDETNQHCWVGTLNEDRAIKDVIGNKDFVSWLERNKLSTNGTITKETIIPAGVYKVSS